MRFDKVTYMTIMMGLILRQMVYYFFLSTFLVSLIVVLTESANHSLDQLMAIKELGGKQSTPKYIGHSLPGTKRFM